jgi:tRNA threonylcarbamoyladenosine biosynthesis protein TsaB
MLVLGIDTATATASVGVVGYGEPLAEESCHAVSSHTETLFPLVTRVLYDAGVSLAEVNGIGVSIGPGSFTGLRVALCAAKGVCYALGQRIVGVPTLEALAGTVADWEGLVCPILDARKREVYAALFRRDEDGIIERLTPDLVLSPVALLSRIHERCIFLGDGIEAYDKLIRQHCGAAARLLPFATHHPRGTVIAKMAGERLSHGHHDNVNALVPRYVRLSEAELKRKESAS